MNVLFGLAPPAAPPVQDRTEDRDTGLMPKTKVPHEINHSNPILLNVRTLLSMEAIMQAVNNIFNILLFVDLTKN